jgi:hypothetical protein
MEVLNTMQQALKTAARVIKWGAGLQESTRKTLVTELQTICGNCESAYDAMLTRLVPVKNAYSDPLKLAAELRALQVDQTVRRQFKPEFLCGQVDQLLAQLHSSLNGLKYSIDMFRIQEVQDCLRTFGNVDGAIFNSYDSFVGALDRIATQIQTHEVDATEAAGYVRHVVDDFEDDMRSLKSQVRETKRVIVGII